MRREGADDALDTRAANLAALGERRRELRSKLRVVGNSLRDASVAATGYNASYFLEAPAEADGSGSEKNDRFHRAGGSRELFRRRIVRLSREQLQREAAQRLDADPPDAVRVEWVLSALGRELCAAVFARFDADEDGAWTFDEFLEYQAALGCGHERSDICSAFASNMETWQMYTSDLFDTDAYSRLTFDGFVMFREAVEQDTPLANDLRALGIAIKWSGLEQMQQCSARFDEYADAEGGVELAAAQFLFAESGRAVMFHELCETVRRQRLLARCHKLILSRKRSLRLFGYRQRSSLVYTNPQVEDEPKICKPGFRSLALSSWIPASMTHWRHWLLKAYLGSFTALRRWQRSTTWAFQIIRQIARTGLLRASCLLSEPQRERGDYVLKLDVGCRFSSHATVHVTYNSDADSAATLHELKYLERGAECFVYLDLTCRSGTKEHDALWISTKLTWFLREYFSEHLENLPFFHKWFVTLPSKLQLRSGPGMSSASGSSSSSSSSSAASSTIVRIVVLFSGAMDLYQVMQSLRLPSSMQFDHMLQRFSLRILCSHSLEEILTSKRLDFGSHWATRAQLDARLNRQAWAQILSQLAKKLEADAQEAADERAFLAAEKERKLQTELQLAHQHRDQQQRKPQTRATNGDSPSTFSDPHNDTAQRDALHGVRVWLEKLAAILKHSQEVSATVSFASVSDVLLGNRWIASVLAPRILRYLKHTITTPGGVASEWKSACDSFRAEFGSTQYAQAGGGSGTARRALSRASSRSSEQFDTSSLEHSISAAFPFAAPVTTSESHKRPAPPTSAGLPTARREVVGSSAGGSTGATGTGDEKETVGGSAKQREEAQEAELLELYDMCAKHLLGVSVIRAEAGTSGLTCVLEGWNIFSVLARVQAPSGKRKSVVRIKSSASGASTTGSTASALGGRSRG